MEELYRARIEMMQKQGMEHLTKVLQANSTRAVEIPNVVVEGTEQLHDSFLASHLQPIINARNVTQLLQGIDEVRETLSTSGALANVGISLDAPTFSSNSTTTLQVVPKLKLTPISRFMAKTGTNVGNGEGDGYITLQWRNIRGAGESLILDATTGTRTRSSYLAQYTAPLLESTRWKLDTAAYQTSRRIDWGSHEQVLRGLRSKIVKSENDLSQEFTIQGVFRSVRPYEGASGSVLAHAGDDLKISVGYDVTKDGRDDKVLPTMGSHVSLSNEVTTAYSTTQFLKQAFSGSWATNWRDGRDILNLSVRGGWLYALNGPSHLMDRFYLGGPNDVRGFFYNGLGARDHGDALGGDAFFSGGASLFTKFPGVSKESGLKLHTFLNFGSCVPWDHSDNTATLVKELLQPSVGCGFGIVFKHPVARFELNFVLPVVAHENDALRKGLQYGVGIQFM